MFVKDYQEYLPEKFNRKFIMLRNRDDVLQYVDSICKALEVIDRITYIGSEIITDESKFKNPGKAKHVKDGKNVESTEWIGLRESRLNLIKIKFSIVDDDKKDVIIEKELYVPKLINNFYFLLNGSKYFPILQIVDKSTYNNIKGKSVILKTLLMPIIIKFDPPKDVLVDVNNNIYKNGKIFSLYLFKHKINIMNYYTARFGLKQALKKMGLSKKIKVVNIKTELSEKIKNKYEVININCKLNMLVRKKFIKKNPQYATNMIYTLHDIFNVRTKHSNLEDVDYWKKRLGLIFTKNTNNQIQKAEKILVSFERIFDTNTKRFLKVDDKYKKDIFSAIRWMLEKFETLYSKNNFDVRNKRIRLYEYLLYPLLMKFSTSTYRILNSKNVTFATLKSIFNTLGPGFIIKRLLTHELLRYSNDSNTIDLFNSALKFTYKGPQSISSSGGLSIKYRSLHPSYLGRISCVASSAGDPGSSGNISPLIKSNGLFFSEENE